MQYLHAMICMQSEVIWRDGGLTLCYTDVIEYIGIT